MGGTGSVKERLDCAGEGSGGPMAASNCMVRAPNCTVTMSDDTMGEQGCTGVAPNLPTARVGQTMAAWEGQTAPSFLPEP